MAVEIAHFDANLDSRPVDDSLLVLQQRHRSEAIWEGQDPGVLTCRQRMAMIMRTWPMDPQIRNHIVESGFYGLYRIGFIEIDWALITALVERWREETHTFHLAVGETTVTLEDTAVLLGLRVDGDVVTGSTDVHWGDLCEELLGLRPDANSLKGSLLSLKWLRHHFLQPPLNADNMSLLRYARAYILGLMGGSIFASKSRPAIDLVFLPLLKDFEAMGRLSWGSAVLACLYRQLCRASRRGVSEIGGPLILLQLWAWERLHIGRPKRLPIQDHNLFASEGEGVAREPLPADPLGCRWKVTSRRKEDPQKKLICYRDQLDWQNEDQMIWQPYTADMLGLLPKICVMDQHMWRTMAPLICFDIVEWHRPERVLRQFGLHQPIPAKCNNSVALHSTDKRGHHSCNWAEYHAHYINLWVGRLLTIIDESVEHLMSSGDPYMTWYRRITRRFIAPCNIRMVQRMVKIHDICTTTLNDPKNDSVMQALTCIRGLCAEAIGKDLDCKELDKTSTSLPAPQPLSWPSDGELSVSWIQNMMSAFDSASRSMAPSDFSSIFPPDAFDNLILSATKILQEDPNCVEIVDCAPGSRVVVVGNIHGQLHDVIFLLHDAGFPSQNQFYVFNGDYVDWGAWGLETLLILLAWKILLPRRVYLLRGSHETKCCTSVYGFEKEVTTKYGELGSIVYQKCLDCFQELPLVSIIAGKVYTAHGGLFHSVAARKFKRKRTCETESEAQNLYLDSLQELEKARRMVLDPKPAEPNLIPSDDSSTTPGLSFNEDRGIDLLWGPDYTDEFLKKFHLKLIIRSHEGRDTREEQDLVLMDQGYTIDHDVQSGRLITLFSAPDYPQFQATDVRYNNKGAYIVLEPPEFDTPLFRSFEAITPRPKVNPYYDYDNMIDFHVEMELQ